MHLVKRRVATHEVGHETGHQVGMFRCERGSVGWDGMSEFL